jgi:hypothetical protein
MTPDHIVFVDERSINTGMTRLYGRPPNGERVLDYTPDVRFERTTLLSSVRANGDMDALPTVMDTFLFGRVPNSMY